MSHFSGSYVRDMQMVLAASALSRQNAIVLGAPGYGKTAVSRSLAQQLTNGQFSFIRIDPSTPPDVVKGAYNPAELLNGRLVRVTDGTPYDSRMLAAIVDELGRANDVTFDALLDTLDRLDTADAPPVWATSNFMPGNERVKALIDRFALWFWVQPGTMDTAAIVASQLNGTAGPQVDMTGLPTWAEVLDVRKAAPGSHAIRAIGDLLANLAQEAATAGHTPHPRRVAQWTQILFRVGVWKAGTADFSTVPDEAVKLLRYAWPSTTPEEAATWAQIAGSVVDAVGAAIEATMTQVIGEMRKVANASPSQRTGMIGGLGLLMQKAQATLEELGDGKDDDRVKGAMMQMNTWLAAAVQGKAIE